MKNCEKIHTKIDAIFPLIIEINRNLAPKIKEADFADQLEPSKI